VNKYHVYEIANTIRHGIDLVGIEHIILGSGCGGAASSPFDTSVIIYSTRVSIDLALSRL
jgi:hypothetical protein